jgi:hypothetical protein
LYSSLFFVKKIRQHVDGLHPSLTYCALSGLD